jgi:hypothetical protein
VAWGAIVTLAGLGLAGPAQADGYGNDGDGVLWHVRTRQGDVVRLGQVRVVRGEDPEVPAFAPELTDVALSPKHGLYAISFSELYRVNLEDPARSTHVGSLGTTLNGLAFDSEDRLFGAGTGGLYRIDLGTGRATHIGAFGVGHGSDGDIVFIDKELWATLSGSGGTLLARLDPTTGKALESHALHLADARRIQDVWGLSWDGRQLLGLCPTGEVLVLDRATGAARVLFETRTRFWGGAIPLRL